MQHFWDTKSKVCLETRAIFVGFTYRSIVQTGNRMTRSPDDSSVPGDASEAFVLPWDLWYIRYWDSGWRFGASEAPAALTGYNRAGECKICVLRWWLQLHFQEHFWVLVRMSSAAQVRRWGKMHTPSPGSEFLLLKCCSETLGILWNLSGDILAPPLLSPMLVQSSQCF